MVISKSGLNFIGKMKRDKEYPTCFSSISVTNGFKYSDILNRDGVIHMCQSIEEETRFSVI